MRPRCSCCAARATTSRCWSGGGRCRCVSCPAPGCFRAAPSIAATATPGPSRRGRRRWGRGSPPAAAIERAYGERGLVAALDRLVYVGRAITPSHSPRRFNTRFFLGDGADICGVPRASAELEEVRWHPVAREPLEPFRDVSRFMLARALALYRGVATGPPPLFYWAKNARRLGICREAQTR